MCRLVKVLVIVLRNEMSSTHTHMPSIYLHLTSALLQKERERNAGEDGNRGGAQRSHQKLEEWKGARELPNGKRKAREREGGGAE